jgi:hypothetical protein
MTFDDVGKIALALPGVEAGTYYGTAAYKVAGKTIVRLREDGETIVLFGVPPEEREVICDAEPEVYFFTDHYRDWPLVLVRLSAAGPEHVRPFLERAWRAKAPRKLQKAIEP